MGKIKLYSFANKVERVAQFSGIKLYFRRCVKSRLFQSDKIAAKFYKKWKTKVAGRVSYGAHSHAPSQAMLQNLKSRSKISILYSDNWIFNIEAMMKLSAEKKEPFFRNYTAFLK